MVAAGVIGGFLLILTIWTIEELSIEENYKDMLGTLWTVSFIILVLWSVYHLGTKT